MPDLRPDRLATLYFFHPLQRLLRRCSAGIPILMYHSISAVDESRSHPYYRTATSVEVFEEQVSFLRENGYSAVSLSDAVSLTQGPAKAAAKCFVMTFDDGFQDFYRQAYPILSRNGYTATVFLPTAYIGDSPRKFNGVECLTWNQVRELRRAGVDFGSHTVSHPQLRHLGAEKIQDEVRSSKQTIEQELGCAVKSFSYPYAFPETDRLFRQQLRGILADAGYENGVSTTIGRADQASDTIFMERLPVNSCDDRRLFRAKLEGGYDWVHPFQRSWKVLSAKLPQHSPCMSFE